MAVLDVIHGIAQNSPDVRLAKNGLVDAGRRSSRDDEKCALEIRTSKRLCLPLHFSLREPLGDGWRHLRRDNAYAGFGRKKALNFPLSDGSATHDHNEPIPKLHENWQQAHG